MLFMLHPVVQSQGVFSQGTLDNEIFMKLEVSPKAVETMLLCDDTAIETPINGGDWSA